MRLSIIFIGGHFKTKPFSSLNFTIFAGGNKYCNQAGNNFFIFFRRCNNMPLFRKDKRPLYASSLTSFAHYRRRRCPQLFFKGSPARYNLANSGNSNISYPICIHDSPFHFIALVWYTLFDNQIKKSLSQKIFCWFSITFHCLVNTKNVSFELFNFWILAFSTIFVHIKCKRSSIRLQC